MIFIVKVLDLVFISCLITMQSFDLKYLDPLYFLNPLNSAREFHFGLGRQPSVDKGERVPGHCWEWRCRLASPHWRWRVPEVAGQLATGDVRGAAPQSTQPRRADRFSRVLGHRSLVLGAPKSDKALLGDAIPYYDVSENVLNAGNI